MKRSFNLLGHFYNPLKQVFLANTPEKVISKSVSYIGSHRNILIIGGGADNTVQELIESDCCAEITHLDISSILSEKAKIRLQNAHPKKSEDVKFVVCPFLDYDTEMNFEAIVFPFYLDLFSNDEILENIEKAKSLLVPNSSMYVVDFSATQDLNWYHSFVVGLLYLLFYPITRVRRKSTPDFDKLFLNSGFIKKKELNFHNGLYTFKKFVLSK